MNQTVSASALDACLPQTQCTRCGYPRCRDYAAALARGAADIDQCPPGGDVTITALARLLGRAPKPLNPAFGAEAPRVRALIDEAHCIGCRKCIDACPVDAIVGAAKLMHTIIREDCTGCGLCVPPCPVDCIELAPVAAAGDAWKEYRRSETERWRALTERRLQRLARGAGQRAGAAKTPSAKETERARIRAEIEAAVLRVRRKRARRTPLPPGEGLG